jgi:hypothetical protein
VQRSQSFAIYPKKPLFGLFCGVYKLSICEWWAQTYSAAPGIFSSERPSILLRPSPPLRATNTTENVSSRDVATHSSASSVALTEPDASTFQYAPLPAGGDSFRLLRILPSLRFESELRCELSTTSIDHESDKYIAGSYVWAGRIHLVKYSSTIHLSKCAKTSCTSFVPVAVDVSSLPYG